MEAEEIKKINDNVNSTKEKMQAANFEIYAQKMLEEAQKSFKRFGLKENLNLIIETCIPLGSAYCDIELYPENQPPITNLKKELEKFIYDREQASNERTFVLLGGAGSGKSTALQIEYIQALKNWKMGDRIPIFIDLSLEYHLEKQWEWLCTEIGLNDFGRLNVFQAGYPVILFVDSYNEAPQKANHISNFYMALANNNKNKAIVCCRNDFLKNNENFLKYFASKEEESDVVLRFITPLRNSGFKLTEDFVKNFYKVWETKEINDLIDIQEVTKIMADYIENTIEYSSMIHIFLKVLPHLIKEKSSSIYDYSLYQVYNKFTELTVKKNYSSITEPFYENYAKKFPNVTEKERIWLLGNEEAAKDLARILYLNNSSSKIDQQSGSSFFEKLNYSKTLTCFSNEVLKNVIIGLNLFVEVKEKVPNERIIIGFSQSTFAEFYLVKLFEEECNSIMISNKENSKVELLGKRLIIDDDNIMRFMVEAIINNQVFKENLYKLVIKSKQNDEESFVVAAANAISVLNAANFSFSGKDLSKIKIRHAVLRDGHFSSTDFSEADLTGVSFENCNLNGALFHKTIMKDLKLGTYPGLEQALSGAIHSCCFYKNGTEILCGTKYGSIKIYDQYLNTVFSLGEYERCIFSPNGKEILTFSGFSLSLWDSTTGILIKSFGDHKMMPFSSYFSLDGEYIMSSSMDRTIMLWQKSTGKLLKTIHDHVGFGFSPDGNEILGSDGLKITLWEKLTGKLLKTLEGHSDFPISTIFSPNGQHILSGSLDKTIKLWEKSSGNLLKTFENTDKLISVAFSPDGQYFLSTSKNSTIGLWEISTGILLNTIHDLVVSNSSVFFSPDGQFILSCSKSNKSIKLWDKSNGELIKNFETDKKPEFAVFSPDGKYVLGSYQDKTAILWEMTTMKIEKTFECHSKKVNSVDFSFDGKYIISGSADCTVKLWEKSTGKLINTFESSKEAQAVAFSPDSHYIAHTDGNSICLREIMAETIINKFEGHSQKILSLVFSPDGNNILSGSKDTTIKLWEISTGKLIKSFECHTDSVNSAIFSPNGHYILSGSNDNKIKLIEKTNGLILKTFEGHSSGVISIAFSSDGLYIVSGSNDGIIKLWERSSGTPLQTISGHSQLVKSVSFSFNGKSILSASKDRTIRIWEISKGKMPKKHRGHLSSIKSVAFSANGLYILSGSADQTLKLWERKTAKLIKTFKGHSNEITSTAFSFDSEYILSGSFDKTIKLWEVSTGKPLKTFEGHTDCVTSVAFSPNKQYVLSGSYDKTIRVWETSTGSLLKKLEGHSNYVLCVAFSPDGEFILSGSNDKTVKLWETFTGALVQSFKADDISAGLSSVAFSLDGQFVLSSDSRENIIKIWEKKTGKLIKTLNNLDRNKALDESSEKSLILSYDGRYAWKSSEKCKQYFHKEEKIIMLKLIEISSEKIFKFFGHLGLVNSVAFSYPDCQYIASGSDDKTIKLWKKPENLMNFLENKLETRIRVAFSSDDLYILFYEDECIKIWEKSSGKLIDKFLSLNDFLKSNFYLENLHNSLSNTICEYTIGYEKTPLYCKNGVFLGVIELSEINEKIFRDVGASFLNDSEN